ncbi:PQ loop repeat protein [uncultured archaeon]|nr:PQ loop repeat protein [uncultured archaeon]
MALLVGTISLAAPKSFPSIVAEKPPEKEKIELLDHKKSSPGPEWACGNVQQAQESRAETAEANEKKTPGWLEDAIGYVASGLIAVAGFPQFLRTVKTKSTKDISLGTFGTFTLGEALFTVYGAMIESWPITSSALVALAMMGSTFFLKLRDVLRTRKDDATLRPAKHP